MKARLTICPTTNIKDYRVVDMDQVIQVDHDWDDVVSIYDEVEKKIRDITVRYISLFDHQLIINGIENKIIHMLSKEVL